MHRLSRAAAAFQRRRDIDDVDTPIRQARLLTVFWWIAAVGSMATVTLYLVSFLFLGRGAFLSF